MQINKMMNEREDITIELTDTERIIREYFGQIFFHRCDLLRLPKLLYKEIENFRRPI